MAVDQMSRRNVMFCVLLRQLWTWVMQGAAQPGMEICFDVLDGVVSCSFLRQLTLPKAPEAAGAADSGTCLP